MIIQNRYLYFTKLLFSGTTVNKFIIYFRKLLKLIFKMTVFFNN